MDENSSAQNKKDFGAHRQAVKIAIIYLAMGCLWILVSDKIANYFVSDPKMLDLVSIIKGWSYIGLTSVLLYILIAKELKKIKSVMHEYEKSKTFFSAVLESSPDIVVFALDNSYCYTAFNNKHYSGMWDTWGEEIAIGNQVLELIGNEVERQRLKENFDRALAGESYSADIVFRNDKFTRVYWKNYYAPVKSIEGNIIGLTCFGLNITDQKKAEEGMLELTYHDVLTGLYNRTFFAEELRRLDTVDHLPLSVITGDINGLKLINDAFGHAEGDKYLIEISKILQCSISQEDVLARIGGDEFCILLPKTDAQCAQLIVDRIRESCEQYTSIANKETYYASISLGHATKVKAEETFGKVFKVAEEYMYRRKMLDYKSQHSSIIASIKTTMFEKSNETEAHAARMAELSKKLGYALGLTEKEIDELELLSTLHDIGKISIDDSILSKCGELTEDEWLEIKRHPEVGFRITQTVPELKHISEYILCHHERWDGKGYPQGLSAEAVPLLSRILAIVDSYDAMTQDRVYRKAMSKEEAISEIRNNSGAQFDPIISKVFIEYVLEQN